MVQPKPNHQEYLKALARMTPAERLLKAFEISSMTRDLFWHGLRRRFADLSEEERSRIFRGRLDRCHNLNY